MNHKPILEAREITKSFGAGHTEVRAVNNVSLTLRSGELVLIMGPSGSGKTTLLSMFGALLRPTSGTILLNGADITALDESSLPRVRAHSVGFVFQSFNLLEALNVEENILFPTQLTQKKSGKEGRQRADALIERLGLVERRRSFPRTLSGGEKQRVAIARALVNAPPLILADEPTGNLDSAKGQEVMMILHDIARDEGRTVVMVTHDPRVEDIADRVLWLEDGTLRDRMRTAREWIRDPVCGMRIDAQASSFSSEHAGRRLVFCSHRCKDRFDAEPARYLRGTLPHDAGLSGGEENP